MVESQSADIIIVGAGIIGLAHAYIAAKAGKRVVVLERDLAAGGASIANFGLIWPIGQTAGRMFDLAIRSRGLWLQVLNEMRIPFHQTGSLHVAARPDEAEVAKEFAELGPPLGYECRWLSATEAHARSSALRAGSVLGALWSSTELTVDPRETLRRLPSFLSERYGVVFHWGCAVHAIQPPRVSTSRGEWYCERVIVCNGADFETLYPAWFAQSGLTRCKLQMLRTRPQPPGWELGPALAGGLTFRFYPTFRICTSLEKLRTRIAAETPEYDRFGVHTMVSQSHTGELTFGDSHEYSLSPSRFNREEIDELILGHLRSFVEFPDFRVAERWYGVYAKHPDAPWVRLRPEPGVEVVNGLGGAGMTLSFGVASETLESAGILEGAA
jgi:D-hydroxyproline dehydrogenase subunit beta